MVDGLFKFVSNSQRYHPIPNETRRGREPRHEPGALLYTLKDVYTVPHLYCTPCREADAQLHSKHDHERTHHGTHAAQRPKPSNGIRPAPEFGTRPHIPFRRNGICMITDLPPRFQPIEVSHPVYAHAHSALLCAWCRPPPAPCPAALTPLDASAAPLATTPGLGMVTSRCCSRNRDAGTCCSDSRRGGA